MKWEPITFEEVNELYETQKKELDATLARLLDYICIPIETCRIRRKKMIESVWVFAETENIVVFYEDVEEGFELGTKDDEGIITCKYSNQWTLGMCLHNLRVQLANQSG
jgi:hypothetical protein